MGSSLTIDWPSHFTPGTTDNFVSNEVFAKGLSSSQIWPLLADITQWEKYYDNASQCTPPPSGNFLSTVGENFSFSTFGFPPLKCRVEEYVEPKSGQAGRIAWRAWSEGAKSEDEKLDVYHTWLVEDVEGGRVRILTQESQIGKPAKDLSGKKPNPMLNKHQDWCEGLVKKARGEEVVLEGTTYI